MNLDDPRIYGFPVELDTDAPRDKIVMHPAIFADIEARGQMLQRRALTWEGKNA